MQKRYKLNAIKYCRDMAHKYLLLINTYVIEIFMFAKTKLDM